METHGQDDLVEYLLADHCRFRTMLERLEAAAGSDRNYIWRLFLQTLTAHETAEQEIVHPWVRRVVDGGDDMVDASLREEQAVEHALVGLQDLDAGAADFDVRVRAFAADVLAHAEREEREELAALQNATTAYQRQRMQSFFMTAKTCAATPVRRPAVGFLDRVRDALHNATHKH
jgi:hemerythrin superfamily protein